MKTIVQSLSLITIVALMLTSCGTLSETKSLDQQFLEACDQGDIPEAERLLGEGANLNARSNYDYTALHLAVYGNRPEMVAFLLQKGLDANVTGRLGVGTVASVAIMKDNVEILELLLDHGAHLTPKGSDSLLFMVIQKKRPKATDYLVKVDTRNLSEEKLILFVAALAKRWDLFPTLIARGAPLTTVEGKGRGIIRYVSEDLETLKLVVVKGANVNNIPNDGVPPASSAILNGELEAAKYLLENGADINPVHNPPRQDSSTPLPPLFAACINVDDRAFLAYLLSKGANPNYVGVDDSGAKITALQLLLLNKKEDLALFLLEKGASPDTAEQRTELKKIATEHNLTKILAKL